MKKTVSLVLAALLSAQTPLPVLADTFLESDSQGMIPFSEEIQELPSGGRAFVDTAAIRESAQLMMRESAVSVEMSAADMNALQKGKIENLPAPLSAKEMHGDGINMHELKKKVRELEGTAVSAAQKKELEEAKAELLLYETAPVYRLYNPNSGEHFYTPSAEEKEALIEMGWKYEGLGWQSMAGNFNRPVYRLYNPNAGDHHYTPDAQERKALIQEFGWIDENIAWYSDPNEGVPVYRTYNPNAKEAGAHHYTLDVNEYTTLGKNGWVNEGVGFYAPAELEGYSICEETSGGKKGIVWYDKKDRRLTGSQQIDGSWYYFEPETGFMLQNTLFKAPDAQDYRVYGHDGKAVTGGVKIDGKLYGFYGPDGYMARHKNMVMTDGSYYRLNDDGTVNTNAFTKGNVRFTPDADGRIETVVHNEIPVYMQTDKEWAKERFTDYIFADIGCLPTTMTSVLNYFGEQELTPVEVGRMLEQKGYLSGNSRLSSTIPLGAVQQGIVWLAQEYDLMLQGSLSEDEMRQILLQGGVLALSVGRSRFTSGLFSHEILVYGYDHGRVMVHDPLSAGNSGVYPLSDLYKIRNLDRYGRASGGPAFGFLNPKTGIAVEEEHQ